MTLSSTAETRYGAERAVSDATIPELFEATVRAFPEAAALLSDDDTVTFRRLNAVANRVAHLLIGLGAGPEQVVGIALPRSLDAIVAMVAVLKAGAVYLPLNPEYPPERIALMVADAAPVAVLTTAEVGLSAADLPGTRVLRWEDLDAGRHPDTDPTDADRTYPLRSGHPLYLIYTSGSTGTPKGVAMPGAGLVNLLAWHAEQFPTGPGIRTANLSAIGFDMGMHEVLAALVHGKCLAVPTEQVRCDPIRLARWLDRHGVHQLFLPNVLIESLCEAATVTDVGLGTLTDIIQSGEPLVLGEAMLEFLRTHPDLRIHNHYGATEMQDATTWTTGASPRPTIGTPLWNVKVYVLDDDLRPVPDGMAGDLYVAGAGLARGYRGRPGLTAERFLPDPFGEPGRRMYRTGDVARWNDDGELECLGRSDNQVKVNGFRVELGEIEARLREHPELAQALVLPRPAPSGGKQLIAYVVPTADASPDARAIRADLVRVLPRHMVPAAVVPMTELPLSPNGKIDLRALPVPAVTASGAAAETPDQHAMLDAFAEVLGAVGAGVDDDFFELGGDSIAAVRLVIRAKRGGLTISTRDVFELGTPRRLAQSATAAVPRTIPVAPLISLHHRQLNRLRTARPDLEQILPVTPVQQGFLFHQLRDDEGFDAYTEQLQLVLRGPLDGAALRGAVRALFDRHAPLRAGFFVDGMPEPLQVIASSVEPPWRESDLSGISPTAAAEQADRLAALSRRLPFDVRTPPLLRVHLIRLPGGEDRLVVDYHHILLDGWSVTLLVHELFAHYRRTDDLPPVASSRDWLRALRAQDHRAAAAAWQAALGGIAEPTVLAPSNGSDPADSARYVLDLSPQVTTRLTEFGRRHRLTANTIVQALWGVLVAAETGSTDVVFGTTVSGRMPEVPGVQDLIGMLINTVPVAVGVRSDEPVLTLLRRFQDEQQRLVPHQHLGLGALQRLLGWSREFDTLLVFENPELQMGSRPGEPEIIDVVHSDDTHYAVNLLVTPGDSLRMAWTYRPHLIDEARIHRLASGLADLLTAVTEDPNRTVAELR